MFVPSKIVCVTPEVGKWGYFWTERDWNQKSCYGNSPRGVIIFVMHICGAKSQEHCFIISRDVVNSVFYNFLVGSRVGVVVRALASHQCVPGSILGPRVICGLSLLLVLYSAPRGFLRVLRFSPLLKKPTFLIPIRFMGQAPKSWASGSGDRTSNPCVWR